MPPQGVAAAILRRAKVYAAVESTLITRLAEMNLSYVTMLSIAGSDPIGGAGIQADIKTCCSAGVYAMTVITAVTAQNTCGVKGFKAIDPHLLESQLRAVLDDVSPDAVKIGMVPDADSVRIISGIIKEYGLTNVVVDPVMVATSGDALTESDTSKALKEDLFPLATLVTPNLPEVDALVPGPGNADRLLSMAEAVLIKGGHGEDDTLTDTLYRRGFAPLTFSHRKIDTPNTHGTGCSLSSMIACRLALGDTLEKAVEEAIDWLHKAILKGAEFRFGHGHGPVCHNIEDTRMKVII